MAIQLSVYCKLALNGTAANVIMESVRRNKPEKGLIHMLTVTEKQFSRMEIVLGDGKCVLQKGWRHCKKSPQSYIFLISLKYDLWLYSGKYGQADCGKSAV